MRRTTAIGVRIATGSALAGIVMVCVVLITHRWPILSTRSTGSATSSTPASAPATTAPAAPSAAPGPPTTAPTPPPPAGAIVVSGVPTCATGSDATAALRTFLQSLHPGSAVVFPAGACYLVQHTLVLQDLQGDTIDGQGSTFERPVPPAEGGDGRWAPQLALFRDSQVTIENLTIEGPGGGGEATEAESGIVVESDTDLTFDHVDMAQITGDDFGAYPWHTHEPPLVDPSAPDLPDTDGLVVENCTWTGAGYHGITIEALQDATFTDDVISGAATDAIDMEYDGGVANPAAGYDFPQQDITFSHDRFVNDGYAVLVVHNTGSVAVDELTFTDNQLMGSTTSRFDIAGVPGHHPVTGLTISDNWAQAATAGPDPVDTVYLTDVQGAVVSGNTFPWAWIVRPAHHADLVKVAVEVGRTSTGVSVEDNRFPGARLPAAGPGVTADCGNTYGVNALGQRQVTQPGC